MSDQATLFWPGTRVLVVDDDPIARTMLRATLESWGVEVWEASDGAEALQVLLGDDPPSLTLLDWEMPHMKGVEVCAALRQSRTEPYLYVILLTAKTEKEDLAVGLESGADDFLSKPFDPVELEARLKSGQRLVRLQEDLFKTQAALRYEATHDALTGLLNRQALFKALEERVGTGRQALLGGDLKGFGFVNQTFGYKQGDEILKEVGQRIAAAVPVDSLVARKGEDQFQVLLTEDDAAKASETAKSWLEAVQRPFQVQGQTFFLDGNVGVSLAPDDAGTAEELVEHAEAALAQAKSRGGGKVAFYDAELHQRRSARVTLASQLAAGLRAQQFSLVYQPIVFLETSEVLGVEALLRWNHPERGLLLPGEFLLVAEETGLIVELGHWVVQQACQQLRQWQEQGLDLFVNLNLSARELLARDMATAWLEASQQGPRKGRDLVVDVSEHTYMTEQFRPALLELGESGVGIALDDFGTGLSNLETIRFAQSKFLKIAASIVSGIPKNRRSMSLCVGVIRLASSLNLRSLAEGVESAQQRDYLLKNDCVLAQGNFFSEPVPAERIQQLVKNGTPGQQIRGVR